MVNAQKQPPEPRLQRYPAQDMRECAPTRIGFASVCVDRSGQGNCADTGGAGHGFDRATGIARLCAAAGKEKRNDLNLHWKAANTGRSRLAAGLFLHPGRIRRMGATGPARARPAIGDAQPRFQACPAAGGLQGVTIEQNLNHQVPLDLVFRDEFGRALPLSTYFSGHKPVLLALVYYTCPMLCNLVLTGMESSLRAISLDPGRDFEVVAVSFDPHDTPEIAAAKRANYLQRYRRPNTANGWHFLTGDEASIKALTSAVAFVISSIRPRDNTRMPAPS
jgi:cytochrome oxidase Cu insertion factor (SCO1/SenC/PrrC family)